MRFEAIFKTPRQAQRMVLKNSAHGERQRIPVLWYNTMVMEMNDVNTKRAGGGPQWSSRMSNHVTLPPAI